MKCGFFFSFYLHILYKKEITHRFQTARSDVRFMLLQCLLPWLENMELLASSIPATVSPLSYIMYYPDTGLKGRRDGAGSTEATEMILNNLFYITAKVIDDVKNDGLYFLPSMNMYFLPIRKIVLEEHQVEKEPESIY